jgi:UTP--glucose-1-phosphate uridylyltransferase
MRANKPEDYKRYGYAIGNEVRPGVLKISEMIEKPGPGRITSDFAIPGGTVYGPEMFDAIEEAMRRLKGENTPRELVYVDALNVLLEQKKELHAVEIQNGRYYDCGNKLEYLKAVVEFGLKHEDLNEDFSKFLKKLKQ